MRPERQIKERIEIYRAQIEDYKHYFTLSQKTGLFIRPPQNTNTVKRYAGRIGWSGHGWNR